MKVYIRSKEQQMIDVFEKYINGNKNEIFDYCLEDYMQIALDYISSLEKRCNKALELLQLIHYKFPEYDSIHNDIEDIQKVLRGVINDNL